MFTKCSCFLLYQLNIVFTLTVDPGSLVTRSAVLLVCNFSLCCLISLSLSCGESKTKLVGGFINLNSVSHDRLPFPKWLNHVLPGCFSSQAQPALSGDGFGLVSFCNMTVMVVLRVQRPRCDRSGNFPSQKRGLFLCMQSKMLFLSTQLPHIFLFESLSCTSEVLKTPPHASSITVCENTHHLLSS